MPCHCNKYSCAGVSCCILCTSDNNIFCLICSLISLVEAEQTIKVNINIAHCMHSVSKWLASQNGIGKLPSFCDTPSFTNFLCCFFSPHLDQWIHKIVCGKETVRWHKVHYEFGLTAGTYETFLTTKSSERRCMRQFHFNGKWIEYLSLYTRSCNA